MKTKVFLSTVMVLLLVVILIFVPQAKAEDPLTDFESGFDGWEPFTQAEGLVQLSTSYAHSGTHSVEQLAQYDRPTNYETDQPIGAIRLPVTSTMDQYELDAWVYVTQRTDTMARSFFGFVFGGWDVWGGMHGYDPYVGWDVWGTTGSFFWVRTSEGAQVNYAVPYGLTLNVWHHVKVIAYSNLGTVSVWLDDNLILDNSSSFNAGEKPTYYYIDSLANNYGSFVAHHYIDDASTSEQPTVHVLIQRLIETIETWNLPKGTENSLTSKLQNAIQSLENGQQNAAVNKLNAFINEVKAQRNKKSTNAQADTLITEAQRIINTIQG